MTMRCQNVCCVFMLGLMSLLPQCMAFSFFTASHDISETPLGMSRSESTMYLDSPSLRKATTLLKTIIPTVSLSSPHQRTFVPHKSKAINEHELSVRKAETSHGMPWSTSIDPTYTGNGPYYMPFWEWQMNFMKEHLTNLRALPTLSSTGRDMSYVENTEEKIRMHTIQFASDEYRLIRMTLMDAGNKTQVFTSLWYPDTDFNLPVLGVDFLQFNRVKHVCISDFQPIQDTEGAHDQPYEHLMEPIRAQFPSLQGKMTRRFYDENQHFSKQMLLAREDKPDAARQLVQNDLPLAFQGYLRTHVDLVKSTARQPHRASEIQSLYKKYDTYSSTRDPAHGLLKRYFGESFADEYVYDILFPLSKDQRV